MKKEDIFTNCIDEIQAGKCTMEDCLVKYPHLSDELRQLLKVATSIQPERVTPSPEFKQRARNRLLEAMQPPVAGAEHRVSGIFGWLKPLAPARRPSFALVAAIVILALLAAGGTTSYAAQGSLPDDALYPVKLATEKARLALTTSEAGKAELHVAFAERRVQEMAEMGRRGEAEEVTMLATALAHHLEQARGLAEVVAAEDVDIRNLKIRLEQSATQQLAVLEEVLGEVPEQTKPSIAQALKRSGEEYGTALEVAISAAPAPMLVAGVGTIQIRATDPPPPNVDSVLVEVEQIEVHRAAGPDSRWIIIVAEPVTFDLLKVAKVQKFLGSQEVPEGSYTQIRLTVTKTTVIADGQEHTASVPSGKLKLIRPFQVKEGETTLILLDFDGGGSLYITGEGDFKLEPEVKLLVPPTTKGAEDEEGKGEKPEKIKETKVEIEGTIESVTPTELGTEVVVAGQKVVLPPDTGIEGTLKPGMVIEVETVAQPDGSFLVTKVEAKGEEGIKVELQESELEIEKGTIDGILKDDAGAVIGVIVNGVKVDISSETEIKGILTEEAQVKVEALVKDGLFLATEIKVEGAKENQTESDEEAAQQQAESDEEAAQQQAESDEEAAQQQAESDEEAAQQQAESDEEAARQQAESDEEAAQQQAESDEEAAQQQAESDEEAAQQQAESDEEAAQQQAESDEEAAQQQAESDEEAAQQQAESDEEAAQQQAESDEEAAQQQAESDEEAARQQAESDS